LEPVQRWLLEQPKWIEVEETIGRRLSQNKYERFAFKHFTSPWVLSALLMCGADPSDNRIVAAVHELCESRQDGLWSWKGTERRIWATADALRGLTDYSLRAARL
ncbi:MAG: hypothetical protein ACR2HV_00935, partial [Acidimicrobiales bacterium]